MQPILRPQLLFSSMCRSTVVFPALQGGMHGYTSAHAWKGRRL